MTVSLVLEQTLNGLQFGVMLFLIAAGLTLVFGIMNLINLAHGVLYMMGAYLCATVIEASGSFLLGVVAAIAGTLVLGTHFGPPTCGHVHREGSGYRLD